MNAPASTPLSGRRAEAARNDQRILDAARAVFLADPTAPISAVAERAGVGIAAVYRRYAGKEALLQQLYGDGLRRFIAEVEAALADDGDPWTVFCRFAHRSLDAGTGSLSLRFTGAFPFTDELERLDAAANQRIWQLFERTRTAGALRPDVDIGDLAWLFLPFQAIQVGDQLRTDQLRHRYLSLLLDGLHASSATPLPGLPLDKDEYDKHWEALADRGVIAGSPSAIEPKSTRQRR